MHKLVSNFRECQKLISIVYFYGSNVNKQIKSLINRQTTTLFEKKMVCLRSFIFKRRERKIDVKLSTNN